MAGLRRGLKANSSRSLGSFVDVHSASSSDFEPVDLEDMESADEGEGTAPTTRQQAMMGKHATPAPGIPPLHPVREQNETRGAAGDSDSQFAEPIQDGLQNLENATHKAAELAKDFTSKLITNGAAEARSSMMKLADDVSSWWAALDPGLAKPQEPLQSTSRATQEGNEVQDLFGLPETEELMDKFPCNLVQTLECQHNNFSKSQQVQYEGHLYITAKNTCFNAAHVRFAIPHPDVKKIARQQGSDKGLLLEFGSKQHVLFRNFSLSDLESALGLLEHLSDS